MAVFFGRPLSVVINNEFAAQAALNDSYSFYFIPQLPFSAALAIIAISTFLIITVYAWKSGRGYCNQICPVGSLLGWISQYSWLKPVINTDKCISCGKCARKCKASCIDSKNHKIDYSRCVACMDCISVCKDGAISYRHLTSTKTEKAEDQTPDSSRRAFITGSAVVAGSLAASALGHGDGGLAPLKLKQKADRKVKLVPPGAKGLKWLASHCTACQLCISNCPNEVLSPSTDLSNFMQPEMDFSKGYCRPECTKCSDLCPAEPYYRLTLQLKALQKLVRLLLMLTSVFLEHMAKNAVCVLRAARRSYRNDRSREKFGKLLRLSMPDCALVVAHANIIVLSAQSHPTAITKQLYMLKELKDITPSNEKNNNFISRRHFLRTASLAAGAMAFVGCDSDKNKTEQTRTLQNRRER